MGNFFKKILTIIEKQIKDDNTKLFIKDKLVLPLIYIIYIELKPFLYTIFGLLIFLLISLINLIYYKLIF